MILTLIILSFKFTDQLIRFEIEVEYLTLMIKKQNIE
jgi:hypothetical protein